MRQVNDQLESQLRNSARQSPEKTVAVVVPLSNRPTLMPSEETSLRHLQHYLGRYDKYMLAPRASKWSHPDFETIRFDDCYFGSGQAITRLMLSRVFYETFSDYKYILIYHLDALVFSDQLLEWCAQGYDYIGPPWLKCKDSPEAGFSVVGNGGFSLRRVSSFLRVMDSQKPEIEPREYWRKYFADRPWYIRIMNWPRWLLKHLRMFNNVRHELAKAGLNAAFGEDHFWAFRATHFDPDFSIAPADVALRFAFQHAPRYCFALNHYQLPFGCHAWPRFEKDFWEPFLLKETRPSEPWP